MGFVIDKVALGQVSSMYFGFPCQSSSHQMLHTHLSSGAGKIGQAVTGVQSGPGLTTPKKIKSKTSSWTKIIFSTCYMRFEVLMAMNNNTTIFWDVTPWSVVEDYPYFGGTLHLRIQGLNFKL
jgi:hypothetical protein